MRLEIFYNVGGLGSSFWGGMAGWLPRSVQGPGSAEMQLLISP